MSAPILANNTQSQMNMNINMMPYDNINSQQYVYNSQNRAVNGYGVGVANNEAMRNGTQLNFQFGDTISNNKLISNRNMYANGQQVTNMPQYQIGQNSSLQPQTQYGYA